MIPVGITSRAWQELSRCARFYESRKPGLGRKVLDRYDEIVDVISAFPESGTLALDDFRWFVMLPFP